MTLTKTVEIEINIDYIIEEYGLDATLNWNSIMLAVDDYVAGLDDCEYYLIDYEDRKRIARMIAKEFDTPEEEDEE